MFILDLMSINVLALLDFKYGSDHLILDCVDFPMIVIHRPVIGMINHDLFVKSQSSTFHEDDLLNWRALLGHYFVFVEKIVLKKSTEDFKFTLTPKATALKLPEEMNVFHKFIFEKGLHNLFEVETMQYEAFRLF